MRYRVCLSYAVTEQMGDREHEHAGVLHLHPSLHRGEERELQLVDDVIAQLRG